MLVHSTNGPSGRGWARPKQEPGTSFRSLACVQAPEDLSHSAAISVHKQGATLEVGQLALKLASVWDASTAGNGSASCAIALATTFSYSNRFCGSEIGQAEQGQLDCAMIPSTPAVTLRGVVTPTARNWNHGGPLEDGISVL